MYGKLADVLGVIETIFYYLLLAQFFVGCEILGMTYLPEPELLCASTASGNLVFLNPSNASLFADLYAGTNGGILCLCEHNHVTV